MVVEVVRQPWLDIETQMVGSLDLHAGSPEDRVLQLMLMNILVRFRRAAAIDRACDISLSLDELCRLAPCGEIDIESLVVP